MLRREKKRRRRKRRRERTRVTVQADSNRDDLSALSIEIPRFVRKDKPGRMRTRTFLKDRKKEERKCDGGSYKTEVMDYAVVLNT